MSENPIILIVGPGESGKTSIMDVVFRRISAYKAYHQEQTSTLQRITMNNNPLFHYDVCELPIIPNGVLQDEFHFNSTYKSELANVASLIYIVDLSQFNMREDPFYTKCPLTLRDLLSELVELNPNLSVSIFFHKTDQNISSEQLSNIQRQMQQSLSDIYTSLDINLPTSYSRTCIFDYSISEALSKCVQKLMPRRPLLQNIVNYFVQSCNIDKVFLFDTYCKICLCQNSTPTDLGFYELCRDNIEVVSDIDSIYENENETNEPSYSLTKLEHYPSSIGIYVSSSIEDTTVVCVLREDHYNKLGLIQHNLKLLTDALYNFSKLHNL